MRQAGVKRTACQPIKSHTQVVTTPNGKPTQCLRPQHSCHVCRVGQNRIYTPYLAVILVISLPKMPYIHRIYMVLANPTCMLCLRVMCLLLCLVGLWLDLIICGLFLCTPNLISAGLYSALSMPPPQPKHLIRPTNFLLVLDNTSLFDYKLQAAVRKPARASPAAVANGTAANSRSAQLPPSQMINLNLASCSAIPSSQAWQNNTKSYFFHFS